LTQVCQEGEQTWRMADEVIEIKSYFISPPRLNAFVADAGNAAPKLDLSPKPVLEELTLPEPNTLEQIATPPVNKKVEPPATGAAPSALRAVCDVCGYKNPRDVAVCMKCGEKLKGSAPPLASSPAVQAAEPKGAIDLSAAKPITAPTPVATEVDIKSSAMVEVPLSKLLVGAVAIALVAGASFLGIHSWKKKHHPPLNRPMSVVQRPTSQQGFMVSGVGGRTSNGQTRRGGKHYDHPVRHTSLSEASKLPGVSTKATPPSKEQASEEKPEAGSYRVIAEATPIQKRYSSPVNSAYAVKRRADQQLWTAQESQAIQQVQRDRIYGGRRTILRNVDILMQVLRDREYNTAFESGKRIYLYNDLDWSAVQKEGPLYEVRLTFSGGKESDGAARKPLHFAFASDLERGTVEPGGEDQVRSNTLHAFFDESKIAPEDRRAIAKDTEELILAAQPDASPLAFDTIVRQFAKVYGTNALSRVAGAYDLINVKKKLAHDPRLGGEEPSGSPAAAQSGSSPSKKPQPQLDAWEQAGMKAPPEPSVSATPASSPDAMKVQQSKRSPKATAAVNGIEFQMEKGSGRERILSVRATSHASVNRLWETLTGYDRLKQFVPDMLDSEREGQDGAAAIVHVTCLTRFMVFVFKLNLHLRIIEHPQQHALEFERIAGDYESLRGSIELSTDPGTRESQIIFHATVVPNGYMTNTKLESMARRLLVAQANAIRTKAESN
jgi:hypothetical protein